MGNGIDKRSPAEKARDDALKHAKSKSTPAPGLAHGKIEAINDTIAEKLDEMTDLGEHWKRNRDKGRMPNAIRSAMIMLADEIVMIRASEIYKQNIKLPNGG